MKQVMSLFCLAAAAALWTLPAAVAQPIESFSGNAYAAGSDTLLFRETHFIYTGDNGGERVVLYGCPDGRAFARKLSRDDGNAQAPDFDLVDARVGYREGVRRLGARREVYVQRSAAQPEQADVLDLPADGVIDTGFNTFAQRHWDALLRGETLRLAYLVPSRRTFYAFKLGKVDLPAAPPGSVTFRMASSSWLSFLLPHIDISYDIATRRLARYEGLSNMRDEKTGKNYRVRFDYPKVAMAHSVGQADVDAALAAPLVRSCMPADNQASASGQAAVPEVTIAPERRDANP